MNSNDYYGHVPAGSDTANTIDTTIRNINWKQGVVTLHAVWSDGTKEHNTPHTPNHDGGILLLDAPDHHQPITGPAGTPLTIPATPPTNPNGPTFNHWETDTGHTYHPNDTITPTMPTDWGSPQRMYAAQLLSNTLIVEDICDRFAPTDRHDHILTDHVKTRLIEKITGQSIESNQNTWNWNNLWNPLLKKSFCGWARNTALVIARADAKRILKGHGEKQFSDFERDDGTNIINDTIGDTTPTIPPLPNNIEIPHPIGEQLLSLRKWAKQPGMTDERMIHRMKTAGYWSPTLNHIDPSLALLALLTPLPRNDAATTAIRNMLGPDDTNQELCELYRISQTRKLTAPEHTRLAQLVEQKALEHHTTIYHEWGRIGATAARLLA